MRVEVSVKIFSNQDHQELTRLLDNGDMPSKCIFQACSSRVSCCSFSFSASLFRFPPFGAGASSLTLNWVSIGFNLVRLQRKHAQTDLATARFRLWLSSLATSNGNMHKSQRFTKYKNLKILERFNSQSLWYHVIHNSAPSIPSLGMFTFLLFSLFAFRTFNFCLLPCLSTLRTLIVPCLWLFRRWRHFFGLCGILRLLRLVFAHKVSC